MAKAMLTPQLKRKIEAYAFGLEEKVTVYPNQAEGGCLCGEIRFKFHFGAKLRSILPLYILSQIYRAPRQLSMSRTSRKM